MSIWTEIEAAIRAAEGNAFRLEAREPLSGGCVADAYRVSGGGTDYFVKLDRADRASAFDAEAAALRELDQANGLRVPRPVACGTAGGRAYLAVEYVSLRPLDAGGMAALGEGLAELHGIVSPRFGWDRDNAIGATPQRNAPSGDWMEFWRENRLGHQLELAVNRGAYSLARTGEKLMMRLDRLLGGHRPEASLVHGDLWGGNAAMDETGRPVLFDPAVYYGDRETDLAMTELFGGFSPLFFEAYHGTWPLDPGYREVRRDLYQLYHLLNHDHLFGGHYGRECLRVMERLVG